MRRAAARPGRRHDGADAVGAAARLRHADGRDGRRRHGGARVVFVEGGTLASVEKLASGRKRVTWTIAADGAGAAAVRARAAPTARARAAVRARGWRGRVRHRAARRWARAEHLLALPRRGGREGQRQRQVEHCRRGDQRGAHLRPRRRHRWRDARPARRRDRADAGRHPGGQAACRTAVRRRDGEDGLCARADDRLHAARVRRLRAIEDSAIARHGADNVEVFHASFEPLEWSLPRAHAAAAATTAEAAAAADAPACYAKLVCDAADGMRVVGLRLWPSRGRDHAGLRGGDAARCDQGRL